MKDTGSKCKKKMHKLEKTLSQHHSNVLLTNKNKNIRPLPQTRVIAVSHPKLISVSGSRTEHPN